MEDPIVCKECGRRYRYDYCRAKLDPLPVKAGTHPGPCSYCGGGIPEPTTESKVSS